MIKIPLCDKLLAQNICFIFKFLNYIFINECVVLDKFHATEAMRNFKFTQKL